MWLEEDGWTPEAQSKLKRKYKKKIGCHQCSNGKIFKTDTYTPFHSDTYSIRCDCTRVPSKKYLKLLNNGTITKFDYDRQLKMFYDNHKHIYN